MRTCTQIHHDVLGQKTIFLDTFLQRNNLAILLNTPNRPQKNIRMFYFMYFHAQRLAGHKFPNAFFHRLHAHFKLLHLFIDQSQSRQSNQHITSTAFKPWITSQNIILSVHMIIELMCRIYQTMIEIIPWSTNLRFKICYLFQLSGLYLRQPGGKDHTLAFLNLQFKITGHIEILIKGISSLQFFRILHSTIPIRLKNKIVFLVQLHVKLGITVIHTSFDTIRHFLIVPVHPCVFMCVLPHTTECQKWAELQSRFGMGVQKRITDDNAVFIMLKHLFFLQNYPSYTIDCSRHLITIKFSNVLMTIRTVIVPLILVKP